MQEPRRAALRSRTAHLPRAQAAWVAPFVAFWLPQVQAVPGQVVQVQGEGCLVSFMVDLLGGSTTGCHRWHDFRRDDPFPTGVCDERSARVLDRSHTSTELPTACPKAGRTFSCPQPVAHADRSLVGPDPCRTE